MSFVVLPTSFLYQTEERSLVHPSFRMWFINQECASGSIPGISDTFAINSGRFQTL